MQSWYCIYTKRGLEDSVCRKLGDFADIELLNPKMKRRKYLRGKPAEIVDELFPCYIFSRFDPYQYFHMIKYTRGVRRFVGDRSGAPFTVDESIIEFIKSKTKEGFVRFDPPRFTEGESVQVTDGPFAGLKGLFLKETKPSERVLVLLSAIQFQARVEVAMDFIGKA